eukprot:5434684-Pyramimonas_sp.AAC.1
MIDRARDGADTSLTSAGRRRLPKNRSSLRSARCPCSSGIFQRLASALAPRARARTRASFRIQRTSLPLCSFACCVCVLVNCDGSYIASDPTLTDGSRDV